MDVKSKVPVRDAMTSRVVTISPDDTLAVAAMLMIKHDIGGVIIAKKGEPLGIVTEKDFGKTVSLFSDLHKNKKH